MTPSLWDDPDLLEDRARGFIVGARAVPNQLPGILEAATVIEALLARIEQLSEGLDGG